MRVKEFNSVHNLEQDVNKWLEENKDKVEVIDIKYSVASFTESKSYDNEYFGCALVIYNMKDL